MSKEVNDNMAMEELQQVQELEKQLAEQYAAAQADAKRRIAVEQRAGEETKKILARSHEECDKMLQAARGRLERTAQWIAEEVVNDKWQS